MGDSIKDMLAAGTGLLTAALGGWATLSNIESLVVIFCSIVGAAVAAGTFALRLKERHEKRRK